MTSLQPSTQKGIRQQPRSHLPQVAKWNQNKSTDSDVLKTRDCKLQRSWLGWRVGEGGKEGKGGEYVLDFLFPPIELHDKMLCVFQKNISKP